MVSGFSCTSLGFSIRTWVDFAGQKSEHDTALIADKQAGKIYERILILRQSVEVWEF